MRGRPSAAARADGMTGAIPPQTAVLQEVAEAARQPKPLPLDHDDAAALRMPAADDAASTQRLTCFDALTGLPNRLLFREQLGLVLRLARRNGTPAAVMLADIDDFRRIKNSLGHRGSDEFIKTVAARIRSCLRDSDVLAGIASSSHLSAVARISGNEFAIILSGLREIHDVQRVAQRLRSVIAEAVTIGGREIYPTLSIGAALFPDDGDEADLLIEHADIALGQAKDKGKDQIQFYNPAMNTLAADRLALEGRLRRAVESEEFFPVFQPRIDCRTGRLCGTEALVRWRHPQRGIVSPAEFIQAAEQSRLIVPIGEFMLDAACRQNKHWQQIGLPPVPMSVNVSAAQVTRPGFVDTVRARARTQRAGGALAGAGDHRVAAARRRRRCAAHLLGGEGARRAHRHRRLRHRLLVAVVPARLPLRRAEDRPLVRAWPAGRDAHLGRHLRHHRPVAPARTSKSSPRAWRPMRRATSWPPTAAT